LELRNSNAEKARCLAVLGTGSEVGKSIVATALCRLFANRGIRIAPFKAQNMSNNSGVTPEGLEMGRAQIVQAEASGIPPHVDMNPILLKPASKIGAQVVLLGKVVDNLSGGDYREKKAALFSTACAALDRLRCKYELVIMEGAGSCAEVNLLPNDIVNFQMADYADAPVILVADIHTGGVFAQIIGTLECLPKPYRNRIAGFIINRFRGDLGLFENGVKWIERKTGKRVFGVLPWYHHITIEAEDSVTIERPETVCLKDIKSPSIAVIRLPHISNFTDFDPLFAVKGLNLFFIEKLQTLYLFRAVILPGSKQTRFDLGWLKETGWAEKLNDYAIKGGHILGICGGYQMMGLSVQDPEGLEGSPGATKGLCLLPVETVLKAPKTTTLTRFSWEGDRGTGYEIHMGHTTLLLNNPLFSIHERNKTPCEQTDGCIANGLRIMGTYIHGLFDTPLITRRWLNSIGLGDLEVSKIHGPAAREQEYNRLAAHFEKNIDVDAIVKAVIRF
jgi:adenosylcobyric acid synthase